jgi:hypothetical protein
MMTMLHVYGKARRVLKGNVIVNVKKVRNYPDCTEIITWHHQRSHPYILPVYHSLPSSRCQEALKMLRRPHSLQHTSL